MGNIKPEGIELANYINDGYFICKECGALMDLDGVLRCPSCGYSVEREDYDYEEYFDDDCDDDRIPTGCMACGGPYPQCTTSCKLFDD